VIVGSHGRSALGRMILGSVGQTLLAESPCSVRIARAPYGPQPGGLRIIVAVDGSSESNAAVRVVASRTWASGTSIRVVAVHDPGPLDTEVGVIVGPTAVGFDYDIDVTEDRAAEAVDVLQRAGMAARSTVLTGRPAGAIIEEAESWAADMIFMGARGHRLLERILIGSVSNAVATRAHCSVEVVREHR
jgi:nucleotide-binding universal stress UspA family protein